MLIFLPPKPFFSTPFHPAAGSGTAPTLVPFYLRRVSTPSASLSEAPLPHCNPARAVRPLSATGTNRTRPIPILANPLPFAKHHGSHGGSYGINKSGAHAPQLPSLLPSAATSQPLDFSSLRPTTLPPLQPSPLSSYRCLLLYHGPPVSSRNPRAANARTGSLCPLLWISFFPPNPRVQIASTSTHPSLRPRAMYSSLPKLRLKLCNKHPPCRLSRRNLLSLYLYILGV